MTTELVAIVLSAVFSTAGITAWGTWFFRNQFSAARQMFFRVMSRHNREDDDRFQALSDDIQRIHLRNAQRDGDVPPPRRTFQRRRYLSDDAGSNEYDVEKESYG